MSSTKARNSSSAENDDKKHAVIIDEKKRKRMLSNRESARRSRMKKEQHIKDLNDQITYYTTRRSEISQKITEISKNYAAIESENRVLRMQGEELKNRLQLLDQMLVSYNNNNNNNNNNNDIDSDFSYVSMLNNDEYLGMDILQDPLLKPWMQPTFQSQTIDGIYQF